MQTAKPITPDRPIGTQQISRIANVSPRTVARWIDRQLLPGYAVPGSTHRRCMPRDLLAFLQQARMPIPPELAAVAGSADPAQLVG